VTRTPGPTCRSSPDEDRPARDITGTAFPDDPTWPATGPPSRQEQNGPLSVLLLARLKAQRGRCPPADPAPARRTRTTAPARVGAMAARHPTAISKLNIAARNGADDQRLIHTACRTRTAPPAAPALLLAASTPTGPA
jgi:hypothetical protein